MNQMDTYKDEDIEIPPDDKLPEVVFRNWLSDEYERFILNDKFVKPIEDSIYAEIGDYTNIITVKYSDILKGKVHHSKKQIDEYVERNTELLDRMFLDFDIC